MGLGHEPPPAFEDVVATVRRQIGMSRVPGAERLCGARWIGVANDTWWWSERPPESATSEGALWRSSGNGRLAANTRVHAGGAWWAQVLLPLPADGADRLLVHEAWHAFGQDASGSRTRAPDGPGDGSLETPGGRALVRCELTALASALSGGSNGWADAERIRLERMALGDAGERLRQERLEAHEGEAESMAWEITGGSDQELADAIETDHEDRTLARTFAYFTEPARRRLRTRSAPPAPTAGPVDEVLNRYDYGTRLDTEERRAEARELQRGARRTAFDGRVLRVRLEPPDVAFDPGQLEPHPLGTWYGTLTWRHPTGAELDVHDGCVIDPEWRAVLLADPIVTPGLVSGPGWQLSVPDGVCLDDLLT